MSHPTSRRMKPPATPPPDVLAIVKRVAELFGVKYQYILSGSSVRAVAHARHDVIRQLRQRGNTLSQIGRWLGLHHTTVHYYQKGVRPRPDPREIKCPDLSGEWAI